MINIVGDINFADDFFDIGIGIGSFLKKGGDPFELLERRSDDFWIGNCECVISNISNKRGLSAESFRISPDALEHIRHFDLYGVANNHVMQHGDMAYQEMTRYFETKGVLHVGSKEQKNCIFEHQNKRIGVLAFSQRSEKYTANPEYWYRPNYKEIEDNIEELKSKEIDCLIAFIHWGNEFINYPYRDQVDFAHWMVDTGVDIVIGMHSHTLQGYEYYCGKPIFYSLGNFLFDMPTLSQRHSCIVHIDLSEENIKVSTSYVKIGKNNCPRIETVDSLNLEYQFEYLNSLIENVNNMDNESYYHEVFNNTRNYRKINMKSILKRVPQLPISTTKHIFKDFLIRRIIKRFSNTVQ